MVTPTVEQLLGLVQQMMSMMVAQPGQPIQLSAQPIHAVLSPVEPVAVAVAAVVPVAAASPVVVPLVEQNPGVEVRTGSAGSLLDPVSADGSEVETDESDLDQDDFDDEELEQLLQTQEACQFVNQTLLEDLQQRSVLLNTEQGRERLSRQLRAAWDAGMATEVTLREVIRDGVPFPIVGREPPQRLNADTLWEARIPVEQLEAQAFEFMHINLAASLVQAQTGQAEIAAGLIAAVCRRLSLLTNLRDRLGYGDGLLNSTAGVVHRKTAIELYMKEVAPGALRFVPADMEAFTSQVRRNSRTDRILVEGDVTVGGVASSSSHLTRASGGASSSTRVPLTDEQRSAKNKARSASRKAKRSRDKAGSGTAVVAPMVVASVTNAEPRGRTSTLATAPRGGSRSPSARSLSAVAPAGNVSGSTRSTGGGGAPRQPPSRRS